MSETSAFTPEYVAGFVNRCLQLGMDANSTEAAFKKHAFNTLLSTPAIYEGFRQGMAKESSLPGMTKAAMARHLSPDHLAIVAEMRIKYASDMLSQQLRQEMGLPEPTWETVPDDLKENCENLVKYANAMGIMDQLNAIPLHQKLLLASLFGGTARGVMRALSPTERDVINQRGALNRFARGAGTGALTGAGAVAGGAGISQALRGTSWGRSPGAQMAGTAGGVVGGGMLGNAVGNMLLS